MSMGLMPCFSMVARCSLFAAQVQQAAVDQGMEGLDPAIQHLGKARVLADVFDLEAGFAQDFGGAAGADELDAERL